MIPVPDGAVVLVDGEMLWSCMVEYSIRESNHPATYATCGWNGPLDPFAAHRHFAWSPRHDVNLACIVHLLVHMHHHCHHCRRRRRCHRRL